MNNTLPTKFFREYGQALGIEPALLKAVQIVESGSRNGMLASGKVQILFEGHIFYRLIKQNLGASEAKKVALTHPGICHPKWDRTKYSGGEKEWERLWQAQKINKDLANQSASWGMFQIMGFNYALCGCQTIEEFVKKMSSSLEEQFKLGIEFMKNTKCLTYLINHEWSKFAKAYNGPGYAQNKYDKKLEDTYKRVTNDF